MTVEAGPSTGFPQEHHGGRLLAGTASDDNLFASVPLRLRAGDPISIRLRRSAEPLNGLRSDSEYRGIPTGGSACLQEPGRGVPARSRYLGES